MKYRYRSKSELKDSGIEWLGQIPQEWELVRGKWLFSNSYEKGNITDVLLSATQDRGVIPKYMVEGAVQNKEDADLSNFKLVRKYDFVISLRSFQGGFEMSEYDRGIITPAYSVLREKKEINRYYFKYLFKESKFINKLNSLTTGIRDGKSIRYEEFSNMILPLPNMEKQNVIVTFLNEKTAQFDSIISKKEALIQKLEEAKKSLISEVVTGKVKVVKIADGYELVERKKEEMKDSGIEWLGEIPKDWKVSKLKYNLSKIGSGKTPKGGAEIYVDEGAIFIRSQNVYNDGLRLNDVVFIDEDTNSEMCNTAVKYNDILLNITGGSIGRSSLVEIKDIVANVNQHVCILRPVLEEINPMLLHAIVQSDIIQTQIEAFQNASNREGLNFEQIANMTMIKIDDLKEQKIIADYIMLAIGNINKITNKTHEHIHQLKQAKQSLISEAVTGKIEIFD